MNFFRIVLLTIVLASLKCLTFAQSELKKVLPPSPDAASLGKFADFPVNLYNGVPAVNIPIWTIEEQGIKVPISLNYHASGIQVGEVSSWVGAGWSLSAGGVIARTVHGIADDASGGFYGDPSLQLPDCNPGNVYNTKHLAYDFFDAALRGQYDSEPDVFFFNFCGRTGKFVFDRSGNIHTIPYQKLKIIRNPSNTSVSAMTDWEIVTEDGTSYYFNEMESMQTITTSRGIDAGNSTTSFASSWYLKEIRSPRTNKKITFEYRSNATEYLTPDVVTEYEYSPNGEYDDSPCMQHGSVTNSRMVMAAAKSISKINFPNGSIEFTLGKYRHDFQGGQVLDKITIKENTRVIKSFSFLYNYFGINSMTEFSSIPDATATTAANSNYRLSLKGIQENGSDNRPGQNYQFTYESSVWLPNRLTSKAIDHWGYYNGITTNTTLLPTYTNSLGHLVIGADRNTVEASAVAGMLTKITYPTGGYTTFAYESNTTNDIFYQDEVKNVSTIAATGMCYLTPGQILDLTTAQSANVQFKLTFSSTKWPTAATAQCAANNFNVSMPSTYIYYNVFEVSNPASPVNMDVLRNGIVGPITIGYASSNYTSDIILPRGKYQIQARKGSPTGPLIQSGVNVDGLYTLKLEGKYVDKSSDANSKKVGGLRIKEMTDYDPVANVGITKYYEYKTDSSTSSGRINFIPSYEYEMKEEQSCSNRNKVNFIVRSTTAYTPLTTLQGGNVGYDKVTVYYGKDAAGNKGVNGKSEFYYATLQDFSLQPSLATYNDQGSFCINQGKIGRTAMYPYASAVSLDWTRGNAYQESSYKYKNGAFIKTNEIVNTYKNDYQGPVDVYNPTFDVMGVKPDWANRVIDLGFLNNSPSITVQYYQVPSRYVKLIKSEERVYNEDGTAYQSKVHGYEYNDYNGDLQLKSESTITSSGDVERKEYKYVSDFTTTPVYQEMKNRNILEPILELKTYKNNILVKTEKGSYSTGNGLFNSATTETVLGQNTVGNKVAYTQYDSDGNLLEQRQNDDYFLSYIYDYSNNQLIAEAKNANVTDIAYTSFEAEGKGNWTFTGTALTAQNSLTGNKCYDLGTGAITKTALNTASTYVVSYWTQNSLPFIIPGTQTGSPLKGKNINGWTYYEHRISGQGSISITGTGMIDELRFYPADAQMVTYTYELQMGISSTCDNGDVVTYYTYDTFGRLKQIKDGAGMILKQFDYQYQIPVTQ